MQANVSLRTTASKPQVTHGFEEVGITLGVWPTHFKDDELGDYVVFLAIQGAKERRKRLLKVLNYATCRSRQLCFTACLHNQPSRNCIVSVLVFCSFTKEVCQNLDNGIRTMALLSVICKQRQTKLELRSQAYSF